MPNLRYLVTIPKITLRFLYFLVTFPLIIILVIFFARPILGPGLPGSDNANFITLTSYLVQWFPKVPFWYPQAGAGVSFTVSYPILNHLIVAAVSLLAHIPVTVSFRLYAVFVSALTPLAIYILAYYLTKKQTVAFLSALFYTISPIAWIFLLEWGFFAEHASYPFAIFAFIFIDRALSGSRFSLLGAIVLSLLTLLSHPSSYFGLLALIFPYLVLRSLLVTSAGVSRLQALKSTLSRGLTVLILTFLLSLFWYTPFTRYRSDVAAGASKGKKDFSLPAQRQNAIYFKSVFNLTNEYAVYKDGLESPSQDVNYFGWRNVSFPFVVSLFALIGLLGSFFLNKKLFSLGLANLLPLTIALSPELSFYLSRIPLVYYFSSWRAMIIPSRFVIPLLSAFGFGSLAFLLFSPLKLIINRTRSKSIAVSLNLLITLFTSITTLVLAAAALFYFRNWPANPSYIISYGPESSFPYNMLDTRDIWKVENDICVEPFSDTERVKPIYCNNQSLAPYFWVNRLKNLCAEVGFKDEIPPSFINVCNNENPSKEDIAAALASCTTASEGSALERLCHARTRSIVEQVTPDNWHNISLTWETNLIGAERDLFKLLPENPNTRVDISTPLGPLLMVGPYYTGVPQLPIYFNQSSLIPTMWNYQLGTFYALDSVWPQPQIVDELTKYFGLEYSFLSENLTPMEKFTPEKWEQLAFHGTFEGLALWHYKNPTGLLTVTTRPKVLVIGQDKVDAYFRIFHLANIGALPFDDALLVKGGQYVDSHSVEELSAFDAVILEGYQYKSREKAWRNLEEYLAQGGSLLIGTGWQYSSADWELAETPDFFPLTKLVWTKADKTDSYNQAGSDLLPSIDITSLPPLYLENQPWGISSGGSSDLRTWAKPALLVGDKVLVAGGEYLSGRVIWTGLDFPGHISAFSDPEPEIALYKNIMAYLLQGKDAGDLKATFTRTYPDKVEFELQEADDNKPAIYWREAYHRDFKAKLITADGRPQALKSYRAGPELTLIPLDKVSVGDRVILAHKTPLSVYAARLVSLITMIFILLKTIKPDFLHHHLKSHHSFLIPKIRSLVHNFVGSHENEDIDY